jgi:hypothetical protein
VGGGPGNIVRKPCTAVLHYNASAIKIGRNLDSREAQAGTGTQEAQVIVFVELFEPLPTETCSEMIDRDSWNFEALVFDNSGSYRLEGVPTRSLTHLPRLRYVHNVPTFKGAVAQKLCQQCKIVNVSKSNNTQGQDSCSRIPVNQKHQLSYTSEFATKIAGTIPC